MEIEKNGEESIITISGNKHPKSMSIEELINFIDCVKTLNETCTNVAMERIRNGKSKSKKK